MERETILRRVVLKCGDFARQLSYHRAMAEYKRSLKLNFWITVFNNAIDQAVLDWFYLFGSYSEDLHWKNVIDNADAFKDGLLMHLEVNEAEWQAYHRTVKDYRDKDLAHMVVRPLSHVPDMTVALKAADFYYRYVLPELISFGGYTGLPDDLVDYHERSLMQTRTIVSRAYEITKEIEERVL